MTDQRVNSILIAMTIMVVSAIVFRISQVSRVFVDIQWQWGRNAMAVFVPISPFTALVSLLVINSHVVFLMAPATEARKLVVETFKYLVYKVRFQTFKSMAIAGNCAINERRQHFFHLWSHQHTIKHDCGQDG